MLINISVPIKTVDEVTLTATRADVKLMGLDYDQQRFFFVLDFGILENSVFVPKREGILGISGGPVYSQLVAFIAPGAASLFPQEIPDLVETLITTLNQTPSLIDGVNVTLEYSPITFVSQ